MIYECLIQSLNEAIAYEKGDKTMGNSEKVAMLPVTGNELKYLINDTIAYIWKLEDTNQAIPERGYDSRKELLQKLKQFDKENFPELECACGGGGNNNGEIQKETR